MAEAVHRKTSTCAATDEDAEEDAEVEDEDVHEEALRLARFALEYFK